MKTMSVPDSPLELAIELLATGVVAYAGLLVFINLLG
jgi:hypothetical protein